MRKAVLTLAFSLLLLLLPAQADAVSMKTTRFVATFEGFLTCPYNDPAGHATIGYGHLLHYGGVTKKDRKRWGCITEAEGLKLLKADLRETEDQVIELLRGTRVPPSMLSALTSFAFNLGSGALDRNKHATRKKPTNIALHVREGKFRKAANEMLLYDGIIVGGKRTELLGLQIRRRKEVRLFLKDTGKVVTCGNDCPEPGNQGGLGPS